jgi:hypothetical protein
MDFDFGQFWMKGQQLPQGRKKAKRSYQLYVELDGSLKPSSISARFSL